MPLSWNEIRHRAIAFSKEWTGAKREQAEKQTFWNEFFNVFGLRRRTVASFEEPVKGLSGRYEYVDLFWPGVALVEHKSRDKDLGKAESQAFRYIQDLAREGREGEIPRYVIVSDFGRIALHDLEPEGQGSLPLFDGRRVATIEFPLGDLHEYIQAFAFIPGYKQQKFEEQDPINIRAVEKLGRLHDALEAGGYKGHQLERFLVRVLFCLFAEDTGIFDEREMFRLYVLNRTAADGSDLGLHLARLFDVLNTPPEKRQKNVDEALAAFRYVNGELFAESLGFADFNSDMRTALLGCAQFDWSRISPAIFGSLFQAVMEPRERRQIGGHYTSERDILRVVRSLFLDSLRAEFDRARGGKADLRRFHEKIAGLRFLDPACGCGNFLVVTYRELRLMDHQMNIRLSEAFGQYFVRLPLKKSPTIVCDNALRRDWGEILPPEKCSYVLGNPPFVGAKFQTDQQRADMDLAAGDVRNRGLLDYVAGWYLKAAEYINGTRIVVGFVSTNSVSQGEQAGILWSELFRRGIKIHFAHRTFVWASEARGKAHVHVVVIGFGAHDVPTKHIYEYEGETVTKFAVRNISPYLVEGPDTVIVNRSRPISDVPEIGIGNKPIDGGYYLFTPNEKAEFLEREPSAEAHFRRWVGSNEFVNGIERWYLWLGDCRPDELRQMPECKRLVELVARYRRGEIPPKGKKATERNTDRNEQTKMLARTPTSFHVENMPKTSFLVIPETGSERRRYLPVGFMSPKEGLCSNLVKVMPDATLFHLGVLSSEMHMAWMRHVGGRMKSDPRYSVKLVYNNFPWPEKPTAKQRASVGQAAQAVLDARKVFPDATLADLYDPLAMPPALVRAHAALDRAVDLSYRPQRFENDRQRVEFLFALYEKLTAPLIPPAKKPRRRAR